MIAAISLYLYVKVYLDMGLDFIFKRYDLQLPLKPTILLVPSMKPKLLKINITLC